MTRSLSLIRPALRRTFSALLALALILPAGLFANAGAQIGTAASNGGNRSYSGFAFTNTGQDRWKLDSRGGLFGVDAINDGDSSSAWQLFGTAASGKWTAGDLYGFTPYVGIIWDEPQSGINRVYLQIDAQLGGLDDLSVQYTPDGENWQSVVFSEITPAETEGGRDLRFMPLYDVTGIRIGLLSGTGAAAPAVREIETFAYVEEYSGPDLSLLQRAADYAGRSFAESNIYGYNSDAWSRLKNAMIDASIADMYCSESGAAGGEYSQADIDAIASELLNAVGGVTGDTAGDTGCNKLQNSVAVCDFFNLSPLNRDYNALSVTDGELFNGGWEPSIPAGAGLYVKLRRKADIDRIILYASGTDSGFTVEFSRDDVTKLGTQEELGRVKWEPLCESSSPTHKNSLSTDTVRYVFDLQRTDGVTAIRLICSENAKSGFCLREIEAFCGSDVSISVKYAQLRNGSGRERVYVASIDSRLCAGKIVKCDFAVTRGGETRTGATFAEIASAQIAFVGEKSIIRITPEDLDSGGDFVFFVLFRNIRDTDELTLGFSLTDP